MEATEAGARDGSQDGASRVLNPPWMAHRRLHLAPEVPAQILAEVVRATFEEAEDVHGRQGP
eukprot:8731626-Prorocentrum_lima.AAC.1